MSDLVESLQFRSEDPGSFLMLYLYCISNDLIIILNIWYFERIKNFMKSSNFKLLS